MLSLEDGQTLVKAARMAVELHLSGKKPDTTERPSSELKENRGVFVTLLDHSRAKMLRGCIGILQPSRPLIEQTKIAAVEAATSDYRFEPLQLEEAKRRIVFEVSVLSPIEPISVKNPLDLRENVIVGRDGLLVDGMGSKGLLLPQVAIDEGFESEEFLSQCCIKADLPPDAWLTGQVRVSRFQAQIFSEETPNGRVVERTLKQTR
ncbi:MAG TPA: TIGR00296 family protein [Candidatus Bathyarchaeia archaeon]|nr:TIGR00296 family protein [Candidatus Bathyarchaeia archaeon]